MTPRVRWLVAIGLGFVVYRIMLEFIGLPAIALGLIVMGCTYALTTALTKPKQGQGSNS